MRIRLIRIGNSKGIRIPQPLLEQTGLEGDLEIRAEANTLVIQSARKAREGWAESFAQMAQCGDDILLGGSTDYDLSSTAMTYNVRLAALNAVMAEWSRTDETITQKMAHLTGTAGGLKSCISTTPGPQSP